MVRTPRSRLASAGALLVVALLGAGGFVAGRASAPEPPTPPVGYADDVEAGDLLLGADPPGGPRLVTTYRVLPQYLTPGTGNEVPVDPGDEVALALDLFARWEVNAANAGTVGGGSYHRLLSAVALPGTPLYADAEDRLRRRELDPSRATDSSGVRRLLVGRPARVGERLYRIDACRDDRELVAPPDPTPADPKPAAAPGARVAVRYHLLRVVLLGQVSSPWRVADAVVLRGPEDVRRICEPTPLPRG